LRSTVQSALADGMARLGDAEGALYRLARLGPASAGEILGAVHLDHYPRVMRDQGRMREGYHPLTAIYAECTAISDGAFPG
jgi:hypothetical protein